jgi:hypothetical protein
MSAVPSSNAAWCKLTEIIPLKVANWRSNARIQTKNVDLIYCGRAACKRHCGCAVLASRLPPVAFGRPDSSGHCFFMHHDDCCWLSMQVNVNSCGKNTVSSGRAQRRSLGMHTGTTQLNYLAGQCFPSNRHAEILCYAVTSREICGI